MKKKKGRGIIVCIGFLALFSFFAIPGEGHAQTAIAPITVATSTSPVVWTTFDASSIVPTTATAVVLKAEAATEDPTPGYIRIRSSATSTANTLLSGGASGGNAAAWTSQGFFSLGPARTFQYAVDQGFDKGWSVKVIGYFTTAPPPISLKSIALTASPFSPATGESTITWSASGGATGCAALDPPGWTTSTAISGSQAVMPGFTETTPISDFVAYALSCSWTGGVSFSGSIDVEPASAPDLTFWINKITISSGETVTISWNATGAVSCSGTGGALSGSQPISGSLDTSPTDTTIYTLTCNFSGGITISKSETVIVGPPSGAPSYGPICPNFGLERTAVYDLQDAAYAYGYDAVTDNIGNVYVVGEQYAPGKGLDMYVAKYNSALVQQWIKVYDNPIFGPGGDESGNESGYGIAITPDGSSVYVVGRQSDPSGIDSDLFIRKYAGNGNLQWADVYNGGFTDLARTVTVDNATGYVYVAGYKQKDINGDTYGDVIDMVVISYSPAGVQQFATSYDYKVDLADPGERNESAYDITVSGANVYVTGYLQSVIDNTDMGLWRIDKTSGVLAAGWPKRYDSESKRTMPASTVTATGATWAYCPTGSSLLSAAGTSITADYTYERCKGSDGSSNWWTSSPATTCTLSCSSYSAGYFNKNTDIGYGVSVDSSGNVFVTGYQDTNGGDLFIRKYDPAGTFVWVDTYNSGGSQNDVGRGVAVGNSGRVFVAGRQQTNNEDALLGENFIHRNVPILPASNPPLSIADWTTTQNVLCEDTYNPPEGWESGYVRTPCNTGSHTQENKPIESCTATSSGTECWWGGAFHNKLRCRGVFHATTCYATLVESGFSTSAISKFIYQGDRAGAPEYNEMAFGVALAPSSLPNVAATSNDVYVVGYTGENGGGMLLNKYSCATTASPVFNSTAVANFDVDPTGGTEPLTVKVDGRASAGNIVSYSWNFGDGTVRNNASSVETYTYDHDIATTQTYDIVLTVRDAKGALYTATQTVTVNPNNAPTAIFTATPPSGPAPLAVSVDGSASTDSPLDIGGSIVSFLWNWGDGTTDGIGEKTTHTYSTKGIYTIRLTVTDNGGATNFIEHTVIVTDQYTCAPACGVGQVCGPGATSADPAQCLSCLSTTDCGAGYRCLGTSCRQGTQCPDGTACPFDGKCPETVSCNPLATSATCPDGSACPATGVCPALKYQCVLSSDAVDTQCYIEEFGGCLIDNDCQGGVVMGKCVGSPGVCQYARCVNETDFACTEDSECAGSDGTCHGGVCNYVYDCAYGPGMGGGTSGLYTATSTTAMPKMPLGVQPDGQACTKPTPDAPNNCEGINGCLYYNYNFNGTPIANSNNSVANCKNTFEGGTGCVYYQDYNVSTGTQTEKANCLPRYAENAKTPPQAGIPEGCFVMDKGKAGKEYDCSAVDGCYYYLDGRVDCRYKNVTAETCASSADCFAQPLAIASCNTATNLCEYSGNGCVYDPNPKGAIACPGATLAATGGNNFVQCLLNKDAGLPGFLLADKGNVLSSCSTNADCQVGQVCIQGTCYPACQDNTDCVTGDACTTTCTTSLDCEGSLVCDAGICVPPTTCVPGTICPNGMLCPASGICPTDIPECFGAFPDTSPIDAISAIIGLTTDTPQTCKYDPSLFVSYASMLYQDAMAPLLVTTHSSEPVPSHNGLNTYFAQCEDAASNLSPVCSISFNQGCSSSTIGADCLTASGTAGTCAPSTGTTLECIPVCSGATPKTPPNLAEGTVSTDIGLTTDTAQTCSYGATPATITSTFGTTGGTTHSEPGVPSHDGKNIYYAQCFDAMLGEYSPVCSIPFDQGCSSSTIGATCFTASGVSGTCGMGAGNVAMCYPVCSGATPATPPNVDPFLTSVTLGLTTDTAQTCSYGATPATITSTFGTTGGTTHSEPGVPTHAYSNVYFAQCYDAALGKYSPTCSIPFTQDPLCPPGFTWNSGTGTCEKPCTSSEMCEGSGACIIDTGVCACPYPMVYSAFYGECASCLNHPEMPECNIICTGPGCIPPSDWCTLHPMSPACMPVPPPPPGASCNTLGYEFTGTAITPSGNCDLVAIILALLSWIAWIIALLAVLSGLRAGYLYITAMGNEKNLILAKRYLIYTTIGVGVSVLTFSIVAITRAILNI